MTRKNTDNQPQETDTVPQAPQFVPETGRPKDVIVAALKTLGGVGHIQEIAAQCTQLGFAQPIPSIRKLLQESSSDAVWAKARKPQDARDLYYNTEGTSKRAGFWGLRGFLASSPSLYPIAGLQRQYSSLLRREETPLDRMKGIANEGRRITAIQVSFSSESEYPNRLLADGRIEVQGEGRFGVQPDNAVNLGMLAAIESGEDIPVFQSLGLKGAKRYAYLGLYHVESSRRQLLQVGAQNSTTDLFTFMLSPIGTKQSSRTTLGSAFTRAEESLNERGGFEQPFLRSIATNAPMRSDAQSIAGDPEVRRQALERRSTAHHELIKVFEAQALLAGLACKCDQYADVLCDGDIFEMKSISNDEVAQARAAVGQLYHYLFIHRNLSDYMNASIYVVFDKRVSNNLREFLVTKARIGVICYENGVFTGDRNTVKCLPWLFDAANQTRKKSQT